MLELHEPLKRNQILPALHLVRVRVYSYWIGCLFFLYLLAENVSVYCTVENTVYMSAAAAVSLPISQPNKKCFCKSFDDSRQYHVRMTTNQPKPTKLNVYEKKIDKIYLHAGMDIRDNEEKKTSILLHIESLKTKDLSRLFFRLYIVMLTYSRAETREKKGC